MKILGTGLSGLVGSRIVELLGDRYEFENLSRETGFDITDKEKTSEVIKKSNAPIILHLAAKTDVDGCEKDREIDTKILGYEDIEKQEDEFKKSNTAYSINVLGTKNVANSCSISGKKIIYISTDFVFDGKRSLPYTEEDAPNPINWYGQTKYEGEKIIQSLELPWVILRIAYPYRANFIRNDFVRTVLERLKNNQSLSMVTDHVMTPTFIDDIAKAIDILIKNDSKGIYHVVGSEFVTPFDAALLIADTFNLNKSLIGKITRKEFFNNRAQRPFYLDIKNDRIVQLGVKMRTFEEGIRKIKEQIE